MTIPSLSIPANCFAGAHSHSILRNFEVCRVQVESKALSNWPAVSQVVSRGSCSVS
jgi:hypothetical protein